MLIRFKVSNYLSFDDVQELTMVSGATRDNREHVLEREGFGILKAAAVFGANASGKSNLIKALAESKRVITNNGRIAANEYFRHKPENRNKPSLFEYEFELDGELYSYGFEIIISKQHVVSEWLHRISIDEDDYVLFTRTGSEITTEMDNEKDRARMEVYIEGMSESRKVLFLHEITRNKSFPADSEMRVFRNVKDWFQNKLRIAYYDYVAPMPDKDDVDWNRLEELLSTFGTGVSHIGFVEEEIPLSPILEFFNEWLGGKKGHSSRNPEHDDLSSEETENRRFNEDEGSKSNIEDRGLIQRRMVFNHEDTVFEYLEESAGTRTLLDLLKILVSTENGTTYVIDEIDNSLHPQLTYRFVKLFCNHDPDIERQLIFTTHESRLLDFDLLRRDEYWFMEKMVKGASRLYSLEDFNERLDRRIDKAYLEGRYGGVPIFDEIFPNLE